MIMKVLALLFCVILIVSCSSSSKTVELVDKGTVATDETQPPSETHRKLTEMLVKLGYEGVGLQYEPDSVLQLLTEAFSDVRMADRQVKSVYTGLHLSYEPRPQALTIGGVIQASEVISYVEKNIPLKLKSK